MGASSYGTGLLGTRTLTDILGLIEQLEVFGEGNLTLANGRKEVGSIYDDSGHQNQGFPTLGYGFNLFDKNTLFSVLDGLLPEGTTYAAGVQNQNVFVAGALAAQQSGHTIMTVQNVRDYFFWLVDQYVLGWTQTTQTLQNQLTYALQQFYAGNGASLYNNGTFVPPIVGVNTGAASLMQFRFTKSLADRTNAEFVLQNLVTGVSNLSEGLAGSGLSIDGKSPGLLLLLQSNGVGVYGSGNLIGAGPSSDAWTALVAAYYQGTKGWLRGVSNGLAFTDPAQAWYALRYAGLSPNRDYVETQLLQINGSSTADTTSLAFQAYGMLTAHRNTIFPFENENGINPDVTVSPNAAPTPTSAMSTAGGQIRSLVGGQHLPYSGYQYSGPQASDVPGANTGRGSFDG